MYAEVKDRTAVWSAEYWAHKGSVRLYVYRKRAAPPKKPDRSPVLFLVHGSSMSSRSGFDLQVPGRPDYSHGINRHKVRHVIHAFLTVPENRSIGG